MGEENICAGPLANNVWFNWMHGKLRAGVIKRLYEFAIEGVEDVIVAAFLDDYPI